MANDMTVSVSDSGGDAEVVSTVVDYHVPIPDRPGLVLRLTFSTLRMVWEANPVLAGVFIPYPERGVEATARLMPMEPELGMDLGEVRRVKDVKPGISSGRASSQTSTCRSAPLCSATSCSARRTSGRTWCSRA
jgi:hypothetical protein